MKLEEITKELLFKPNTVFCPNDLATAIELLRLADSYGAENFKQYPIFRQTKNTNCLYNKTHRALISIVHDFYEYFELKKINKKQFDSHIESYMKWIIGLHINGDEKICRHFGSESNWSKRSYYENNDFYTFEIIEVDSTDDIFIDFDLPNRDNWFFATTELYEKIREFYPKYKDEIVKFLKK